MDLYKKMKKREKLALVLGNAGQMTEHLYVTLELKRVGLSVTVHFYCMAMNLSQSMIRPVIC